MRRRSFNPCRYGTLLRALGIRLQANVRFPPIVDIRRSSSKARMSDGLPFSGTKIALLCDGMVVTYLRDAKDGIPFPGLWDLPGGGREGEESPIDCALREVEEEFGLRLQRDRVHSLRRYKAGVAGATDTYFCVAEVTGVELQQVRFGSEGQCWALMGVSDFIARKDAVPDLQRKLQQHLSGE